MKRTFTTLALTAALLLTAGVSNSFARNSDNTSFARTNDNGNDKVNAWFHKDFSQAELLDTKTSPDYTRCTFRMSGMILTAYYSNNGELLAITHNIVSTQLPLTLLMQVRRDYADFWITDLFELNRNGESTYYITLENADKTMTLRSGNNSWGVYTKSAKK